jgi:hypothetical protein
MFLEFEKPPQHRDLNHGCFARSRRSERPKMDLRRAISDRKSDQQQKTVTNLTNACRAGLNPPAETPAV